MSCKTKYCQTASLLNGTTGVVGGANARDENNIPDWVKSDQRLAAESTDAAVLDELAKSPYRHLRTMVVNNPATSIETIKNMAASSYGLEAAAIARRLDKAGEDLSDLIVAAKFDPTVAKIVAQSKSADRKTLMALAKFGITDALTNPVLSKEDIAEVFKEVYSWPPFTDEKAGGRMAVLALPRDRIADSVFSQILTTFQHNKELNTENEVAAMAKAPSLPPDVIRTLCDIARRDPYRNRQITMALMRRDDLNDEQRKQLRCHNGLEFLTWAQPEIASADDIREWRDAPPYSGGVTLYGRWFTPAAQANVTLGVLKNPNTPASIRDQLLEEADFSVKAMLAAYEADPIEESTMKLLASHLHVTEYAFNILSHGNFSLKATEIVANRVLDDIEGGVGVPERVCEAFEKVVDPAIISRAIDIGNSNILAALSKNKTVV